TPSTVPMRSKSSSEKANGMYERITPARTNYKDRCDEVVYPMPYLHRVYSTGQNRRCVRQKQCSGSVSWKSGRCLNGPRRRRVGAVRPLVIVVQVGRRNDPVLHLFHRLIDFVGRHDLAGVEALRSILQPEINDLTRP